jgi:U3 small nucleolar ribonucleoprotein protein IMP3
MRELKHFEKKLLKKTDFYQWKNQNNLHQIGVIRKYRLTDREDYNRYNKLCGLVTKLCSLLKVLKSDDKFRTAISSQLIDKVTQLPLKILALRYWIDQYQRVS